MSNRHASSKFDSFRQSFRYCPQCGRQENFSYNDNKILCLSCEYSFYINPTAAVVALLFNENRELLLSERKGDPHKGKFDFPGGFVSINESLEDALHREIKEELNLEIEDLEYYASCPTVYEFEGLIYHPVDVVYKCTAKDWKVLKAGDDVNSVCFKSVFDVAEEELAFSTNKLIIKRLQSDME